VTFSKLQTLIMSQHALLSLQKTYLKNIEEDKSVSQGIINFQSS